MDSSPWWTADYALSPHWPVLVAAAAVLAVAVWRRHSGSRRGAELAFVVLAWGSVAAATLTPIPRVARACDLVVSVAGWEHLGTWPHERWLNVALFVPVGAAVWLARRRWLALAIAVVSPFVIEWLQAVLPALGRACDANDVVANLLGVVVGLALGAAVLAVVAVPDVGSARGSDPV